MQGSQVKVCEDLMEEKGLLTCLVDRSETIGDIQMDPSKCPGDLKSTLVREVLDDLFSQASLKDVTRGIPRGIDILEESNGVTCLQYDYLPGLIIKIQGEQGWDDEEMHSLLYSVPLSNMMRKIIRVDVMDLLEVPCKRLYHIPDSPLEIGIESYIVVEASVDSLGRDETFDKLSLLSKEDARPYTQQLCSLIEQSGFRGCSLENICLSADRRKLVITHTEPRGSILLRQQASRYEILSGEQREKEINLAKMGLQDLLQLPFNQEATDESLQECFASLSEESQKNRNKNNLLMVVPVIVCLFAVAVLAIERFTREIR